MTLDALRYYYPLIVFPIGMDMNISVTLGTRNPFCCMNTGIMFGVLFFVAALALNPLHLDLFFLMFCQVDNVDMTTGTGVLAMHGGCKIMDGETIAVTAKTGGGIYCHTLLSTSQ